jgi:hypothetical protein
MLWAVANTLTIFAVRNVGLAIAFPLWNTNSLVGLFWGWLLFKELRGSGVKGWSKVLGGAFAIVGGAAVLAIATAQQQSNAPGKAAGGHRGRSRRGRAARHHVYSLPQGLHQRHEPAFVRHHLHLRRAGHRSHPGTSFYGGAGNLAAELHRARPMLFWPFLGGFCWVIGDLFQNFAAKYIGIGRGIPLSNTNQLWGLAWGALVFAEFSGLSTSGKGADPHRIAGDDRGRCIHQHGRPRRRRNW